MRRFSTRFALLCTLSLLSACAGGDSPAGPTIPPPRPAPIPPGVLSLAVAGLPTGTNAAITVANAAFSRDAIGTVGWVDVPAGQYTITVRPVRTAEGTYAATPATFTVTVVSGSTPATATVTYAPLPSAIDLAISGVPSGVDAPVTVSPPGSGDVAVTASRLLSNANTGRWKVAAGTLRSGGARYSPSPAAIDTLVLYGDTARVAVRYDVSSGALAVALTGLPTGLAGAVQVTGPEGFTRALTATSTLTELTPGAYRVIATAVAAGGITYRPAADTTTVTVSASLTAAPAAVTYAAQVGRVVVTTSGLPADAAPAMTLTLAGGTTARALSGPATIDSLPVGSYTLSASRLTVAGVRYMPAATTQNLAITTGNTTTINVAFAVVPTVVDVPVSGLPTGAAAAITLTAPSGVASPISATTRISPAAAGRWRLSAGSVTSGGASYLPSPAARDTTVAAGDTLRLPVQYTIATGSIAVVVSGLPGGASGSITVTGPGGYTRSVNSTTTLTLLAPGSYTVTAANVTTASTTYLPTRTSQQVTVVASLVAAPAAVSYAVAIVVDVDVSGLPTGAAANITLTAPSGVASPISATTRISPAAAGRWRLNASSVTSGGASYRPTPTALDTTVTTGDTLRLPVQYTIATGSMAVVVGGLPGGASGSITITGPGGYTRSVTANTTLTLLAPGSYTVTAANVTAAGTTYVPSPTSQQVAVVASPVAAPATVSYAVATGAVTIATSGLPGGVTPTFTLTGTGSPRAASGAGTVSALTIGTWTITANTIVSGTTTYTPSPSSLNVSITPNGTATASFAYTATVAPTNFTITNVYLTQAIQTLDNTVTLVAGRDALLRVFVQANAANSARPDVRVRIYDGTSLLQTATITAPETSVRTAIAEGTLSSTWNLLVPGANIRTTTRVLVDLDPTLAITDADRRDNTWPSNGTPQRVSVNTVPTFTVRFVPIVVGALTGNVSAGNSASFLSSVRRMFPLGTVSSDVRAPFTSSATDIQSSDGNGQWLTVLNEINALRTTDGAPSTMHYYGVLKVSYTSGIAGYGYVPGRAAIGWDHLPSGDRVAAHEWGHNFSRSHAPCGTTGDANYPYPGGVINFWGWNSLSNTLVSPTSTDVMGYCGNQWISDYNWSAVMQYRSASGGVSSPSAPNEGLLVWGRVVNGQIQLEPAFRVTAPVSASAVSASHRLELLDADGTTLLDTPIEAQRVDHATATDERQFAVVVPWSATLEARLAAIRVRDARSPLAAVARKSARMTAPGTGGTGGTPVAPQLQAQVDRTTDGRARVTWNSSAYPMAMVRDASTGALMGFVRRSGDAVVTGGRAIDVIFSDGVRSVRR